MEAFGNAGMMMLVLFVVVALGYAARKFGLMDDEFDRRLSKLVIWVTCPGLILDSVLGNGNLPDNDIIWQVLAVSFGLFILITAIALLTPRLYPINRMTRTAKAASVSENCMRAIERHAVLCPKARYHR